VSRYNTVIYLSHRGTSSPWGSFFETIWKYGEIYVNVEKGIVYLKEGCSAEWIFTI
jgi:hypothetical protein